MSQLLESINDVGWGMTVLILVNFTRSGRKENPVWLYFDKTKIVGKVGCQEMWQRNAGTCRQNTF